MSKFDDYGNNMDELGSRFGPIRWLTNTGGGNLVLTLFAYLVVAGLPAWLIYDPAIGFHFGVFVPLFISVTIFVFWMATTYGNPLNWWVPYFGYNIKVDFSKHYSRLGFPDHVDSDFKVKDEITAWLNEMCKGRYFLMNFSKIRFLKKKDAAMFKLVWM